MSSLLSGTPIPLWVWIIIIVVGSLVVLGTIALVVRLLIIRRRQAAFVDTFGDEDLPQRSLTVRRGRVIEQSKYLSLTGSKFGLNAFGLEDSDAQSRAGARSKSPFEWWLTISNRSQSRNSEVTQITNDASSIHGPPTSPGYTRVYQRRDFNHSTPTLVSASEKDDVSTTITESVPSPPRVVRNFSRSFSRPGHPPRMNTLSRIEEASPHTSMISTSQSRVMSYASSRANMRTSASPVSPILPTNQFRSQEQIASRVCTAVYDTTSPSSNTLQVPASVAYGGTGSRLSQSSSLASLQDSTTSRPHSHITALPQQAPSKQPGAYWTTRTDLHPARTSSKRGNVLRKKSLKKAEMVTQVDS